MHPETIDLVYCPVQKCFVDKVEKELAEQRRKATPRKILAVFYAIVGICSYEFGVFGFWETTALMATVWLFSDVTIMNR